jgi:hypothetical protein
MGKNKKTKRKPKQKGKKKEKEKVVKVVDDVPIKVEKPAPAAKKEKIPVVVKDNKEVPLKIVEEKKKAESYHTAYNRKKKIERNQGLIKQFNDIMMKLERPNLNYNGESNYGLMKMKSKLLDHLLGSFENKAYGFTKEQLEKLLAIENKEMRDHLIKTMGVV